MSRKSPATHKVQSVDLSSAATFRSTDEFRNRMQQSCSLIVEHEIFPPANWSPGEAMFTIVISTQTAYGAPIASIISEHVATKLDLPQETRSAVHTALHEAITNAVIHGNLGLSSPASALEDFDRYYASITQRLADPAYANRSVIIEVAQHEHLLICSVHDEGQGFNYVQVLGNNESYKNNTGIFVMMSLGAHVTYAEGGRSVVLKFSLDKPRAISELRQNSSVNTSILSSRILIVEDTELSRFILGEILIKHGFSDIHYATNGMEALDMTRALAPDLVLLDLLMPVMDGFEYCQEIRKIARFSTMPVLVLTGITTPEHRNKIFSLGASDMVLKPANSDELIARCTLHLERNYYLNELQYFKERISLDLEQARAMQDLLMPHELVLAQIKKNYGVRIGSHSESFSEMGGDFWGAAPLNGHQMALYICDFSGHGVTAALNTFRLHALIHDMMKRAGEDPGTFLTKMNAALFPLISRNQFCTILYGMLDIRENTLQYAAAACPAPFMWKGESEQIELLDGSGVPLGAVKDTVYETRRVPFGASDLLMLYSDALIETPNKSNVFISDEALSKMVRQVLQNPLCKGNAREQTAVLLITEMFFEQTGKVLRDDLTVAMFGR